MVTGRSRSDRLANIPKIDRTTGARNSLAAQRGRCDSGLPDVVTAANAVAVATQLPIPTGLRRVAKEQP